jgi:hypothetical protein
MTDAEMLSKVKKALGITGNYQDDTLSEYIAEVKSYLLGAGISENNITSGIVARGVTDLWNYGAGEGKLSAYFMQRATQLSYKR